MGTSTRTATTSTAGATRGGATGTPHLGSALDPDESVVKQVLHEVTDKQAPVLASAIAFWGFVSIFPALLAAITVYGLFADPSTVQSTVRSLFGTFSPQAQSVIGDALSDVAGGSGGGLGFGLLLSLLGVLWSASAVTSYLLKTASLACDQEPRSGVRARLLALPVTLVFLLVAALAIGAVAVLPGVLTAAGPGGGANAGLGALGYAVALALLVGAGVVLYAKGPAEGGPSARHATTGAAVGAGVWLVGSLAFSLYVSSFGSYSATYGAVGGILVTLLWFFLSGFAIVLGMLVASVLARRERSPVTPYPS